MDSRNTTPAKRGSGNGNPTPKRGQVMAGICGYLKEAVITLATGLLPSRNEEGSNGISNSASASNGNTSGHESNA